MDNVAKNQKTAKISRILHRALQENLNKLGSFANIWRQLNEF